jgi:hypothetical protein
VPPCPSLRSKGLYRCGISDIKKGSHKINNYAIHGRARDFDRKQAAKQVLLGHVSHECMAHGHVSHECMAHGHSFGAVTIINLRAIRISFIFSTASMEYIVLGLSREKMPRDNNFRDNFSIIKNFEM